MVVSSYQRGLWAEKAACWYLRLKGYRILEQRFNTPGGEIDMIATRGKTLVFAEVKYRPTHNLGICAITPRQQQRIACAAQYFLQKNRMRWIIHRFDVIVLDRLYRIKHIQDAWRLY